MANTAQT